MPSSILNSDDGVISGTSGLKSSGGDDGVLVFQSKGTETARINTDKQIVAAAGTASLPALTTTGDVNTGIFFPAADTIAFAEGGAEAMRINSSGNVGIGTTTPDVPLTVRSNSGGNAVRLLGRAADGFAFLIFRNNADSAGNGEIGISDAQNMLFTVGGSERMRIDSSGNLLVGTTTSAGIITAVSASLTTATASFDSSGASNFQRCVITKMSGRSPNDASSYFLAGNDTTATRYIMYSNGGLHNYSANNSNLSDRREKTNFAPAKNYLETICSIPVQTFNYIDQNNEDDPGLTLGVVAQDVQEVAPELVMESNWAGKDEEPKMRLSIYQTDLQYALMKCIQELSAKNDALEARLSALEQA